MISRVPTIGRGTSYFRDEVVGARPSSVRRISASGFGELTSRRKKPVNVPPGFNIIF